MIAAAALGVLYLAGVLRVRRWLAWRSVAFGLGLVALAAALEWPDGTLPEHMLQHVLLTLVAPPLLLLGAPHVLALRALRGNARAALLRLLQRRLLSSPTPLLTLFASLMVLTHLHTTLAYASAHAALHAAEHALLFTTALLFWTPLVAAPPAHRLGPLGRIAYLFAAMAPMGAVGALLGGKAGAIMWVGGGYVLLTAIIAAVWAALVAEERHQQAREVHGR
jgi:putative membrane protein